MLQIEFGNARCLTAMINNVPLKQVEDQDAQLKMQQKELKEKTVHLQQVEQMCRRQKLELDNRAAKFSELDQILVGLRRKFEESREENLQLTQLLRTTK